MAIAVIVRVVLNKTLLLSAAETGTVILFGMVQTARLTERSLKRMGMHYNTNKISNIRS